MKSSSTIRTCRAYDVTERQRGYRVLVDRLWPRGVSKEDLRLDEWLKDVAPSATLRKWFQHDPERWDEFRTRYFAELDAIPQVFDGLKARVKRRPLLLIYGARDVEHNNAVALKDYLTSYLQHAGDR